MMQMHVIMVHFWTILASFQFQIQQQPIGSIITISPACKWDDTWM